MNVRWSVGVLAASLALSASGDLFACGDKFLVPSRGVRFELTPTVRERAAILIYVNPASSLPGLFTRLSVDHALRKAGYNPTVATSAADFDRSLRQTWDVVLVDLSDGPLAAPAGGTPAVLAVAFNASKADLDKAKKQYAAVLKSPSRSQAFVDELDVAVASRNAARTKASANGKTRAN